MSIYVIRHAEKEHGDFYQPPLRHNDQPISGLGRDKALRLATFFRPIDVEAIYTSEYIRTQQTIAPVAEEKGLVPIVDARLNEIDVGDIERLDEKELKRSYPDFWDAYITRDREFRIPGGENGMEAQERILNLFDSLDKSKNHMLSTHEGLIRILLCAVLGIPPYRRHLFKMDFCSITKFKYDAEFSCWVVRQVNMPVSGQSV